MKNRNGISDPLSILAVLSNFLLDQGGLVGFTYAGVTCCDTDEQVFVDAVSAKYGFSELL